MSIQTAPPRPPLRDSLVAFFRQAGVSVGQAAVLAIALALFVGVAWGVTVGVSLVMGR